MRLYFAGNVLDQDRFLHDAGVRNRLLTFAEIDSFGSKGFTFWLDRELKDKHLFIDCGAFSVHSRGASIDLDRYCQFAHEYRDQYKTLVALDVIGNPAATRRNLAYMRAQGLDPTPVYTASQPIRDLVALLEEGNRKIALGGSLPRQAGLEEWRRRHFDRVFKATEKFWPVRYHLFGITAQWALERYPLYSADSSAALVGAGMGRLWFFEDGKLSGGDWPEHAKEFQEASVCDVIGKTSGTKSTSAHMGRRLFNTEVQLRYERHLTDLWASRGITFED